jgi:hypothetical protein
MIVMNISDELSEDIMPALQIVKECLLCLESTDMRDDNVNDCAKESIRLLGIDGAAA